MKRIIPVILMALLLPLLAHGQQETDGTGDEEQLVASSSLELLADQPEPGLAVKARLRKEALAYVLENPCAWSLQTDSELVPAAMYMPAGSPPGQPVALQILDRGKPQDRDSVIIIDRGPDPVDFDELELEFSSTEMLTSVLPAAGPTREDFSQQGKEQLVMQSVGEDGVLSITSISFSPLPVNRYLRLTIREGGNHRLESVRCSQSARLPELHEVPVALGPMRSLPGGAGSMWPLVLQANQIPLRKLKVIADAPGMVRRIRFVRIDDSLHEVYEEAQTVYADSLSANGLTRTENYLELPGGMSSQQPALVVEDGSGTVLPIRSVQAYATEVYLCFNWPESGIPRLVAGSADNGAFQMPDEDGLGLVGTLSSVEPALNLAAANEEESAASQEGGSFSGFLSDLGLELSIPGISIGRNVLFPAAGICLLLSLLLLLGARRADLRE